MKGKGDENGERKIARRDDENRKITENANRKLRYVIKQQTKRKERKPRKNEKERDILQ